MTTQATLCAILNTFYPEQMKIAPPTVSVTRNQTSQFVFSVKFADDTLFENVNAGNHKLRDFLDYYSCTGGLSDDEFWWYAWYNPRQFEIRIDWLSSLGTVEKFEKGFKQWVFAIRDQKKQKIDKLMSDIEKLRKEASEVLDLLRVESEIPISVSYDYEQPIR